MINKRLQRIRRAKRARAKIKELGTARLCVYRSANNIYAQLISSGSETVLTTASTLDKAIRKNGKHHGNKEAAAVVGKLIAERAKQAGVKQVAFDRSGFKYHGCVKALAEAARENGLEF